jgi:hypothetical protein
MTNRKFYALYNHYGTRMAYGEYNCPTVYAFNSKKERDKWVQEDYFDGNWHRESCSAALARKYGKHQGQNGYEFVSA